MHARARQSSAGTGTASPERDQADGATAGLHLGPSRKQNVACDSCRARKVKCNRAPGAERCIHCTQKDIPCTTHYIDQLTSARKQKQAMRDAAPLSGFSVTGAPPSTARPTPPETKRPDGLRCGWPSSDSDSAEPNIVHPPFPRSTSPQPDNRPSKRAKINPPAYASLTLDSLAPLPAPRQTPDQAGDQGKLLEYLFSPHLARSTAFGYIDRQQYLPLEQSNAGYNAALQQTPTTAHMRLLREDERLDLANDLIETYFQIVQIRMPFVRAHLFKERYANPGGTKGPNANLAIAMVLAWGARFSEHPIIVQDRAESSVGLPGGRKWSRLVLILSMRFQWIMDHDGADKAATLDNLSAQCSLGALRAGDPLLNVTAYRTAVACALALGYNTKEGLNRITDSKARSYAGYAFWLLMESASSATLYRRQRPALLDGDWDFDLKDFDTSNNWGTDVQLWGRSSVMDWLIYQEAFDELFRQFRQISSQWWRPRTQKDGLPLSDIKIFTEQLVAWKDRYLVQVGVPTIWPPTWDFGAAVAACTVDIVFHSTWPVISAAIDDYGIREIKQIDRGDPLGLGEDPMQTRIECNRARERVEQEALHASLRVSALAAVLAVNNYLRLDPFTVAHAIHVAGKYLAIHGRHEATNAISGLRDIGGVFYECYDMADEIEALAAANIRSRMPSTPHMMSARHGFARDDGSASESPSISGASLSGEARRYSAAEHTQRASSLSRPSPVAAARSAGSNPMDPPPESTYAGYDSNGWDPQFLKGQADVSIPQDFWPSAQAAGEHISPYPPVVQAGMGGATAVPSYGGSYTGGIGASNGDRAGY